PKGPDQGARRRGLRGVRFRRGAPLVSLRQRRPDPLRHPCRSLAQRQVGDWVNLEADLLAKYSERLLAARGWGLPSAGQALPTEAVLPLSSPIPTPPATTSEDAPITAAWLAERGW
ncbi:MAG: hypothetical protein ACK550_13700, partial [Synechococcaceae cyanobacterium]